MLPQQWSYLPSEAPPCLGTEWVGLGSIGLGVWVDILKFVSLRVQIKNKGLYIYNYIYIKSFYFQRSFYFRRSVVEKPNEPTNQPSSCENSKYVPCAAFIARRGRSLVWNLCHPGDGNMWGTMGGTGYCSRCLISGELFDGYFGKEAFAIDMGIFMDIYQLANFLAMMCFNSQGWMEPLTCVMSSIFRIPILKLPNLDPWPISMLIGLRGN